LEYNFLPLVEKIKPAALNKACYRAVYKQFGDPLSTAGNEKASGRWHIKGQFNALYLSEDKNVCIEELKRRIDDISLIRELFDIYQVNISASNILDLSSPENLKILGINREDLTGGSVVKPEEVAVPNALAEAAFRAGFEGLIAGSAAGSGNNVVIFPKNLLAGSSVKAGEKSLW
jgi:RES domain-containing protein